MKSVICYKRIWIFTVIHWHAVKAYGTVAAWLHSFLTLMPYGE